MSLSWEDSEAHCQRCTALTRQGNGIFCANFGKPVLGLTLYHNAWCPPCYRQRSGTYFLVYTGSDHQSLPIPNEVSYYLQARHGDSLFSPFECDDCVFSESQMGQVILTTDSIKIS
jgi:hypothetical protein